MRIFHILFYGFFLIIYIMDSNKDFAIGRATLGPTFILMFLKCSFIILLCALFCYSISSLLLFGLSLSSSFIVNEYYFTYLGRGDEVVEKEPKVLNKFLTIIFALSTVILAIVFFVWSSSLAQKIIEKCV